MSPSAAFVSDSDSAVQALVDACNKPRASLEAPSLPHLIGRELLPYDFGDSTNPLDAPASSSGKSGKRKGSPQHAPRRPLSSGAAPVPHTKPAKKQASPRSAGTSSSSESEAEAHTPPRHANKAARPTPQAPFRSVSPPSSVPQCPGVFKAAPRPDALPLPSALLMKAACFQVAAPRLAVVA